MRAFSIRLAGASLIALAAAGCKSRNFPDARSLLCIVTASGMYHADGQLAVNAGSGPGPAQDARVEASS